MSSEDARARPSQVTVAGWTAVAASVIVVLTVFEAMGDLYSVDTRERLTETVTGGTFRGLGISVEDALEWTRWSLYVAGVAAVVTGVLGVYVLRRDKVARVVLTVAAVAVVIASPVDAKFPGMIVGACAALLWTRPARDWFAGRPVTPPPVRPRREVEPPPAPVPEIRGPEGDHQPPPTPSWGAPPPRTDFPPPTGGPVPASWAPPTGPPVASQVPPSVTPPDARPRQVRIACVLTWVATAVSVVGALLLVLVALTDEDALIDEVVADSRWDASADPDLIVPAVLGFAVVVILWCLLNAVLAWFVWRRRRGAWIGLLVSVALAAGVSVIGFPPSLLHMAALAGALGLLTSAPTRAWFRPGGPPEPGAPSPPR